MIAGLIVGALFATTTASGIPQYRRSLEIVSMRAVVEEIGPINSSVHINTSWVPLADEDRQLTDESVFSAIDTHLGELVEGSGRLVKSRIHWWGWLETGLRTDSLASQSSFQYIENIDDHVEYIEGIAPTDSVTNVDGKPAIEVAIEHDRAKHLRISIGDVIDSQSVDGGTGLVRAIVTGTFTPTDPGERFWMELGEAYLSPSIEGREQPLIMLPTSNSMFTLVAEANAGLPASYDWFFFIDQTLLADMSIAELETTFDDLADQLENTVARPFVITELIPRVETMKQRALFGSIPLLLMTLLTLACVAFYLTMAAGLLGRKRINGYMMLRSRGFNVKQQLGIHAIGAAIVSIPAAIVAPLVSTLVIAVIGYLPAYNSITNGSTMPVELYPTIWIWSFGGAIGTILVVTAASSFWDEATLAASRSSDARPVSALWFQRYYIDALLVALSAIVWWEVGARNAIVVLERGGDFSPDFSLLAAPVLIVMASSLVALRLFPIITRFLAEIGLKSNSLGLGLGLASVARRPFFHGWPMLAIILSISTGVVAGSVVSTLERSTNEQVLYSTGADIHVTTIGTTGQVAHEQLEKVRDLETIDVVTPALRTVATVGTTSTGSQFNLLSIDPIDFQQVAWFRDDFSNSRATIDQLVDRLAVRVLPEPIELPPDSIDLSMWVNVQPVTPMLELWVVLKDGLGEPHTINLGQFEEGWYNATGHLGAFPQPVRITSIQTFMTVGPDSAPLSTLLVDDLVVTTADGARHLVIDFDVPELWKGLPTAEGEDTGFTIAPEPDGISGYIANDAGNGVGSVSLGRGSSQGIRGIYRQAVDRPIPIIASEAFMSQTGVGLHRPFVINVLGGLVPVEVIGTVIYFPTLDPERGPFAVTDVDALIDFIELRGHRKTVPNELFASLEPTDFPNEEIGQQVRKVFRLARIDLRAERIVSTFIDPIAVAGWRGMSIVATIVAGLVVLMAYAVFMAAFALRTKGDVALKLALGASTRDQWLSTVAELFPAIFVGAVVGLGTGFAVSSLMVGSMAYTDTGAHLLPPFILQTNWMLPVVTIAAIFTIALAGVVNSVRSLHEIQIAEMAREGFSAASI